MGITKWYGNQDPRTDYRESRRIYSELRFLGADPKEAKEIVNEVTRLRGGVSRLQILTSRFKELLAAHYDDVRALVKEGPKGSRNAYRANGWVKSPAIAISKAAKLADDMLWAEGWRGGGATPETLVPECLVEEMTKLWTEIFLD